MLTENQVFGPMGYIITDCGRWWYNGIFNGKWIS
jgi:hypothetical protein